jgi:Tfp pilus assembly PilM family ATPase
MPSLKKRTFFNLFPTPEYLSLSNSGIAITEDGIKFIELHHGLVGKGLTFSHYKTLPLPEGAVYGGLIYDPKDVAAALKELKDKHGLTFTRATLPEEKAYLFSASIPRVPVEGLKDAVAFIIEENAPVKLAESVFDFDIISSSPDSSHVEVTVSVLPRKIVESYTEVFATAGITPVSYDIESQAISRALIPAEDQKSWLIINVENKKTGFYVVEAGVVRFSTTLPYGASGQNLNELKTEIRKIFAFWSAREAKPEMQKKIDQVLLSGSGSDNHKFVKELMDEFSVEYGWGDPWANLPNNGNGIPKGLSTQASSFSSVIGLALPHPHRPYV